MNWSPDPATPSLMHMTWEHLLFAHWVVPAATLRALIPAPLQLDTWNGQAYLGVVPFHMTGVRARWLPPVPGTSALPEVNVRTYVRHGEHAGVWFFSLDAGSRLAVWGARRFFHLPYYNAHFQLQTSEHQIVYRTRRTHQGAPPAELDMTYGPTGPAYEAAPDTLDDWLTHRLCLFARSPAGVVYRGDIAHRRWPLQPAHAQVRTCHMTKLVGGVPLEGEPLLHYARRVDVVAAWRVPIDAAGGSRNDAGAGATCTPKAFEAATPASGPFLRRVPADASTGCRPAPQPATAHSATVVARGHARTFTPTPDDASQVRNGFLAAPQHAALARGGLAG